MNDQLDLILHSSAPRHDKVVALLYALGAPTKPSRLRDFAVERGLREAKQWNMTEVLKRTRGGAVSCPTGWRLTSSGSEKAEAMGLNRGSPQLLSTYSQLRTQIGSLASTESQAFLHEALGCLESGYHRAAIVMSWVAAAYVLQQQVVKHHLASFNAEAAKRDSRWTPAKSEDDLSKIKEADFLDILAKIGALQKNVKTELKNCLDRRNACGHPNSYKVSELTAAHHVEILTMNVFSKI